MSEVVARAYAARLEADAAAADATEPIAGGTLLRTPELPDIWDLNAALLGPGSTGADVLAALGTDGVPRVTVFADCRMEADGWRREDDLLMVRGEDAVAAPDGVREVEPAVLAPVRIADAFGPQIAAMHDRYAAAGVRTFAWLEDGVPLAWSALANGCVDDVETVPTARRRGLGRAVTAAALAAGGWFLWCSREDPVPQHLYRSLGMEVAGTVVQFTRA